MRRAAFRLVPVLAATATCIVAAAWRAPSRTADEIIAKFIEARGGRANMASVHTARLFGTISFGNGQSGPLVVSITRPPRIRTQFTLNGRTIVQGYDGKIAWLLANDTAHTLPPDQAKNVAAGADFDGPLVDYAAKGETVTLAALDTADGRPAYRLRVVLTSGLVDEYFIDTVSWMQTKWRGNRVQDGQPIVFESWFRDYRAVGGVQFAFRIDSRTVGRAGAQLIALDSVQVNPQFPPDLFAMPPRTANANE